MYAFDIERPSTIADAANALKADEAQALGGGQTLIPTLKQRLAHAGISEIQVKRAGNKLNVSILTSRPGIIIGRKGSEVDRLREDLANQLMG